MKWVIKIDPVQMTEIYQITDRGMVSVYSCKTPQESIDFIKNIATKNENTEVVFMGPKSYTDYFVKEVNKLDFVTASQG